ncbi:MAG: UbiA family prenyltransferase, partial [Pseudomonadota bacterium]
KEGLHSMPIRLGIKKSLRLTRILHACTVVLFLLLGISFSLGIVFYVGMSLVALFLWYENHIVSPDDLSRINVSFFTVNGVVSIFTFIFTFISVVYPL